MLVGWGVDRDGHIRVPRSEIGALGGVDGC
jgi:hypothetical protein